MTFHSRAGLTFRREEDGAVIVELVTDPDNALLVDEGIRLTASEWASVVASVSRRGDGREAWDDAMALHNMRSDAGGKEG